MGSARKLLKWYMKGERMAWDVEMLFNEAKKGVLMIP